LRILEDGLSKLSGEEEEALTLPNILLSFDTHTHTVSKQQSLLESENKDRIWF
jgi:hypothetical protein